MRALGVDPGMSGALALLDGDQLVAVADMATVGGQVSAKLTADLITDWQPEVAYIEQVAAFPRNGSIGNFKLGLSYGIVLGVLGSLEVPTIGVRPAVWKQAMKLSKDKGMSRRRAIELWPAHADSFKRVRDDGRAEAALIALWGHRQ